MAPTYQSGAFVQQCFASHPLCLGVKTLTLPDRIVLACSSCHFQHQIRFRRMTAQLSVALKERGNADGVEAVAEERLACCVRDHAGAVRVGEMDVVQDTFALRCTECRRLYRIDVAAFQTQAP